jgi:hypothetical protein
VYRLYEQFMVAREAGATGLVRRIDYDDVERIVRESGVAPEERYLLPAGILDEKNWRDRSVMQHHASAPGRGK